LTIVTNALNVAAEMAAAEEVTVVVLGGMLRSSELSLIGHITELALKEVRIDKVVLSIPAISLEAGLTNDYLPEVMTDRTIIEAAHELILVADHTKFGRVASAYLTPIERVTTLVTDSETPLAILNGIRELGVQVIVAE
jgi:DeoR/GlpR family transcriptional regulator of sugar metabolism